MPQIIVTADRGSEKREAPPVLWREWVNPEDFQSEVFNRHLVQRLGWAIDDASKVEESTETRAPVAH
jgi:hypothetical protein